MLLVGTWYKTREHASRSLVFQSANAGFGVIASLIMYAIGSATQGREGVQPWRYISYVSRQLRYVARIAVLTRQFLGGLTTFVGCLCLLLLGTPSEVLWLNKEEKDMVSELLNRHMLSCLTSCRQVLVSDQTTPETTRPLLRAGSGSKSASVSLTLASGLLA